MEFLQIYNTHFRSIRTFILKMVRDEWIADDLTQETFIKARENLNGLRDESKIRSWIFQIARNRCMDFFRSRSITMDGLEINDIVIDGSEPNVQQHLEQNQMSDCVQDKIQLLPEPLREILILFEVMELHYQEIADILEIGVGNVKVRLHRARKALKEILIRDCSFEHDERNVMVCHPLSINSKSVYDNLRLA